MPKRKGSKRTKRKERQMTAETIRKKKLQKLNTREIDLQTLAKALRKQHEDLADTAMGRTGVLRTTDYSKERKGGLLHEQDVGDLWSSVSEMAKIDDKLERIKKELEHIEKKRKSEQMDRIKLGALVVLRERHGIEDPIDMENLRKLAEGEKLPKPLLLDLKERLSKIFFRDKVKGSVAEALRIYYRR